MYGKDTLEDIEALDAFLSEGRQSLLPRPKLEEDTSTTLSEVLNTWYQISVDDNHKVSYLHRDFEKDPVIDRIKKEVTFQTQEGIVLILTYEIDDLAT